MLVVLVERPPLRGSSVVVPASSTPGTSRTFSRTWRTKRAVYWISNTLLQTLPKSQMLALAQSLGKVD